MLDTYTETFNALAFIHKNMENAREIYEDGGTNFMMVRFGNEEKSSSLNPEKLDAAKAFVAQAARKAIAPDGTRDVAYQNVEINIEGNIIIYFGPKISK